MSGDFRSLKTVGLAAFLICPLLGCGEKVKDPNWPGPVTVSGSVTMDGKPLSNAMVLYVPEAGTVGQGGSGMTNDSGQYKVSSRNAKGEMVEGVIPGKYRVAISRMVKPDGSVWTPDPENKEGPASVGAREELPMEYSDPRSSMWLVDIIAGGPPQDFPLAKQ